MKKKQTSKKTPLQKASILDLVRILTREEAKLTCPGLTHDEEVLVSDPPTVFEAFFYRCL